MVALPKVAWGSCTSGSVPLGTWSPAWRGEDEDAGQKASVEDAASTAAADAAGENADNDNLESILLQKGATTRLLQKTSTPPTGPLTKDTKLPWDGIQDTLDELDAFPAPHGKALLQKQKM